MMVCLVPADALHPAPLAKSAPQTRTRSAVLLLHGDYGGVPIKPLLCLRGGASDDDAGAGSADDGGDGAGGKTVGERACMLLRLACCWIVTGAHALVMMNMFLSLWSFAFRVPLLFFAFCYSVLRLFISSFISSFICYSVLRLYISSFYVLPPPTQSYARLSSSTWST